MAKHTEGPWEASSNAVHKRISPHYAAAIALVFDPTAGNEGTDVTRANARLIAASPRVLAALQHLTRFVEQHFMVYDCDRESFDAVMDEADAAIAEATKEQS